MNKREQRVHQGAFITQRTKDLTGKSYTIGYKRPSLEAKVPQLN